jgi:hypothetical protein
MKKFLVLALCAMLGAGAVLAADEGKKKETKWHDRITVGGNFRLRYEMFRWPGKYDDGERDRFRYRLRFGLKAQVTDSLDVGIELASGNPQNPISDNQSFDNGFDKKELSVSQAWAKWQATDFFAIQAGKFRPKGIWTATDFEWDDDLTVEGFIQTFDWKFGGVVERLDFNLWQLIMNESGSGPESRNWGGQVGPTFGIGEKNDLSVGVSYMQFENPSAVAELYFDDDLVIDSGYVTNFVDPDTGELTSEFKLGNVYAEWKNKSFRRFPLRLTLFFFKNFGASDEIGQILPAPAEDPATPLYTGRGSDNDSAFFGRLQVGDYKKPGQVAVRFSRYDYEPDATFFAYAQSDTRRASNVDGYRVDVRVGMPARSFINVTWYSTDWKHNSIPEEESTMNRWQFDYIIRF